MSVFESDSSAAAAYTEPKEVKGEVYKKSKTLPSLPRELTPWGQMIKELVEAGCNDTTYEDVWRLARSQVCLKCKEFDEYVKDKQFDTTYLSYSEQQHIENIGWHGPVTQICKKYGKRAVLFGENKRKPINLKHAKQIR